MVKTQFNNVKLVVWTDIEDLYKISNIVEDDLDELFERVVVYDSHFGDASGNYRQKYTLNMTMVADELVTKRMVTDQLEESLRGSLQNSDIESGSSSVYIREPKDK